MEPVLWIIDLAHGPQKSLHHIDLVKYRQLHRHLWQLLKMAGRLRRALPVFQKQINDDVTVNPVCRKADEHTHVANRPDDRGEASLHIGLEKLPRRIVRSRAT